MDVVEPFSRAMIEKYLRSLGVRFLVDSDGDFRVDFGYDDKQGCELSFYFIASGEHDEIYVIRAYSDKRIPKDEWARAVMLCNIWNCDHRWPKAYLQVRNPATDAYGFIFLEEQIDLEKGVHQNLLNHLSSSILVAAGRFWEWAHSEKGL